MTKVLIIGATGSLAKYVIEALKELPDTALTLFVRKARRLEKDVAKDCKIIEGDATEYSDIKGAVAGTHIVYVNLAGDLEVMTENIVQAMQETGVKRIIAICSIGIYESPLKPVLEPYRRLADIIEASGLDYTVLRPDWFTNGDETEYALTQKGTPETGRAISRKSIADFIALLVGNPELHNKENLGISRPG